MNVQDKLLRPGVVAKRLGISRHTVRELLDSGRLSGLIDPETRQSKIWESSVDAYLERCRVKARSRPSA